MHIKFSECLDQNWSRYCHKRGYLGSYSSWPYCPSQVVIDKTIVSKEGKHTAKTGNMYTQSMCGVMLITSMTPLWPSAKRIPQAGLPFAIKTDRVDKVAESFPQSDVHARSWTMIHFTPPDLLLLSLISQKKLWVCSITIWNCEEFVHNWIAGGPGVATLFLEFDTVEVEQSWRGVSAADKVFFI